MTNHGWATLDHTSTYALFIGPSWSNSNFVGDKISSIQSFFQGFGGSNYANTATEYGPSNASAFAGTFYDYASPPTGDPSSSVFGFYFCYNFLPRYGLNPDIYALYVAYSTDPPYPIGNNYVALGFHSSYSCRGAIIHYAVILNSDNSGYVIDTQHYHSDNAAALVNTTAHELIEAITDALPGSGWFTQNTTGEMADKCNFSFGPSPYQTLSNGAVFKVQGQWSNRAFQTGTGFQNANGEAGCLNSAQAAPRPQISGPSSGGVWATCNWTSTVAGGVPPFTYSWAVHTYNNGQATGTWVYPVGSSQNFSSTYYSNNYWDTGNVTLTVTDARGWTGSTIKYLTGHLGGGCY